MSERLEAQREKLLAERQRCAHCCHGRCWECETAERVRTLEASVKSCQIFDSERRQLD
jgi:hypothetical protein